MTWFRGDDRLHSHRKTRAALKTHPEKLRDAAPMGLWVLAGTWASQNATSGWVPEEELDRFDDDWDDLAARLVNAGFWWPETRNAERGYGFVNWEEYNPSAGQPSESGTYGNHVRWHVSREKVAEDCPHCPTEPTPDPMDAESAPDDPNLSRANRGRVAPRSGAESQSIALPNPIPTQPDPIPLLSESDDSDEFDDTGSTPKPNTEAEFDQWYAGYPRKEGKGQARKAYKTARKKADQQTLIAGVARLAAQRLERQFTPLPATWLNGERWLDEIAPNTAQTALDDLPPEWKERPKTDPYEGMDLTNWSPDDA